MPQKVTIKVKKKPQQRQASSQPKRGPIDLATPSKRPARRRLQKGGIRFFDVGQKWNEGLGQFVENPIVVSYASYFSLTLEGFLISPCPNIADYSAYQNEPLNSSSAERYQKYKEITNDEAWKYGLIVRDLNTWEEYPVGRNGDLDIDGQVIENSKLTDKGMELDFDLGRCSIESTGFFSQVMFNKATEENGTKVKVTEDPSFASAGVDNFKLPKQCSVFLMPKILGGFNTFNFGDDTWLSFGAYTRSRDFYLNNIINSPFSPPPRPISVIRSPGFENDEAGLQREILRSMDAVNFVHYHGRTEPDPISEIIPYSAVPGSILFLHYHALPNSFGRPIAAVPYGGLIAIIDSGSKVFYVWSTDVIDSAFPQLYYNPNLISADGPSYFGEVILAPF